MTTSDYKKVFTQLNAKPIKKAKFIKFNAPKERSCGIALRNVKTVAECVDTSTNMVYIFAGNVSGKWRQD